MIIYKSGMDRQRIIILKNTDPICIRKIRYTYSSKVDMNWNILIFVPNSAFNLDHNVQFLTIPIDQYSHPTSIIS